MNLTLHNYFQSHITLVENEFIDHYMAKANGEYVKVYLLLLRHLNNSNSTFNISHVADCLENTESDILRALKYWEKKNLFTLLYDDNHNMTGIDFGYAESQSASPVSNINTVIPVIQTPEPPTAPSQTTFDEATIPTVAEAPKKKSNVNRKELKQILFIAEQYLGKTLTRTDVDAITYFYDNLNFSADLIEYLIEYCVENGHKSIHYIQKVALAWADDHISTVEQAKSSSSLYNRTCYSVLQAFGIKGRGPATPELEFIKKWSEKEGFDLEIILEACNRTVLAIHQPSFEYADKILQNWHANQVHTMKDIRALDLSYEQSKAESRRPAPAKTTAQPSPSKFRNFEERSYNMDELTKELLGMN